MDEINKIQVEKQKENEQNVQNQNCFDENDINSNIPKLQKATSITINTKCSHNSSMGRTPISDILHVGNDSMDDDDDNISFMTSKLIHSTSNDTGLIFQNNNGSYNILNNSEKKTNI